MKIEKTCPFCGTKSVVIVNEKQYAEWENGKLIQDAFPDLSADDREILLTGICPRCWGDWVFFDDI